jgi:hypothetical protein
VSTPHCRRGAARQEGVAGCSCGGSLLPCYPTGCGGQRPTWDLPVPGHWGPGAYIRSAPGPTPDRWMEDGVSNSRRLRRAAGHRLSPRQRAAQDQALAAARDMAARYDATVTVYERDPIVACLYAKAWDAPCAEGPRYGVRLYLPYIDESPTEYPACPAHVLLVLQTITQALRRAGVLREMFLTVDPRLDGATAP